MLALEMVNKIQRRLRMPLSQGVTAPHAALILQCVNDAQRNLLPEGCVWDELKVYGGYDTSIGGQLYTIEGFAEKEIDVLRDMTVDGATAPMTQLSDDDFREKKRAFGTTQGQPLYYRIHSRAGGNGVVIELLPIPDAVYTVNTEALIKPPLLTADASEIMLDADTLFLGAMLLVRKEEGLDYDGDLLLFQSKISLVSSTRGESNWQDVEVV